MSKKIVCFTDSLCSGGAQRQLVGLACLLKKQGYDVSVLVYWDDMFYKHLLDTEKIDVYLVGNIKNPLVRLWRLYKFFKSADIDTVIAYQETPSLIACIFNTILRWRRLIVSERNTTQKVGWKDWIRFQMFRVANYIVPNSHTQSTFIKENAKHLSAKVQTITNFIDTEYFKPIARPVSNENVIIGVGRVTPQKNIHTLIEALSIVKKNGYNFVVKWFGRSDNEDYARLCSDLIEEYDVADRFIFEGQNKNIRDEYYEAYALCLPSLYEGFPNVICEAMGCGLPILCSDICDNPYIVEDGINGFLFAANDAKSMAMKMEEFLLLSLEQKREMSVNSRKIAECKFSAKEFINKYILLIE